MKSDRIKNSPKEERPREKLLAEGAEKQTDANLLAVILRVGRGTFKKGAPGQSAQALAHTFLTVSRASRGWTARRSKTSWRLPASAMLRLPKAPPRGRASTPHARKWEP
jgi:hypothetical protein